MKKMPPAEKWMADAYCQSVDPDMFFPEDGQNAREAKKICERCPVTFECLNYALHYRLDDGVWGGTSPRDRRALRFKMAKATP